MKNENFKVELNKLISKRNRGEKGRKTLEKRKLSGKKKALKKEA